MSLNDEVLELNEASGKTRPPKTLYCTDLTKPCLKNAYLGIVNTRPYSLRTLRVFQAGNLLESYWVEALKRHPANEVLRQQILAYYNFNGWEVHGRCLFKKPGNSPSARVPSLGMKAAVARMSREHLMSGVTRF